MHPVFLAVILFSLLTSALVCHRIMKTKANKGTRILVAFSVNALVLSIASACLYKWDVQTFHKQTEGLFDSLGIVTLIFFVPINALINIYIMEFFKNKRQGATLNVK
ncbi:hypothetical protein KQ939_00510 [Planococcus sp. CP5-4]|uniref:hypothetical protein n=1 Tax=unclassified Planococcus (in: firmicutes) TaxID=2662419 RepID=UPI001C211552|nr:MULTISPECIES: hypothetical protein [unclassified Planococcus (in: firmicutes)]MBU9673348.1 hypothetical protein [Planococcus sp. CP5-4_YE]MBV0908121.1 hypothetical protein [Planococcus sp. CP5-4_UN]MBW6062182.1 hypothetical protein [Planococcus sp. CP5-4]